MIRQDIRKSIRARRQQLSKEAQIQAANQLVEQVNCIDLFTTAKNIAIYTANDGELDTLPLIQALWQQHKHVYLPILHPFSKGHLIFQQYTPTTPMTHNRFGIAEPALDCRYILPIHHFDIIFTPLVAFDQQGNRLGMGGGFYDRTLSALTQVNGTSQNTHVIGLAHDCQEIDHVPTESWDIPISQILTPTRHLIFKNRVIT
ncbi:5-formyltetrahydrofolate cyclo-ligase [Flocculibacter collagenilyticus]|uniref:5-formyltetrahydrofolate cyclo-ligase n=1 Tax=Flocculibacter collagenilyticus TaxID=2744479 RepID=UPI0018F69D54|nr:5-formyltetrahydrofolate cyclo-ligase [Flocculibacter collagenilyticus]